VTRENWANLDSLEIRPDRLCPKSTYLQAPPEWLGEQFLAEADYVRETNEREYRHEYLGEPTGNGGEVFENLEIRAITDEEIERFDHIYNGVDWGWYPDPWAFNRVHYDAARRIVYIFDEARENKMYNDATAELLKKKGLTRDDLITADSAEPKSIADYNKSGLRCVGAVKGAGSVEAGMKWLQSRTKIVIDPDRCRKTAEEFSCYEYQRTLDGEIISGYPDYDNHNIDAVRYALERVWRKPGEPVYRKYISPFGG
jgi:phage terminase large subunit